MGIMGFHSENLYVVYWLFASFLVIVNLYVLPKLFFKAK